MKTIYKYELDIRDTQELAIPKGAAVLTVQMKNETPCIWAKVDMEERQTERMKIMIFSTGQPADAAEGMSYAGTFQLPVVGYVYHVFYSIKL